MNIIDRWSLKLRDAMWLCGRLAANLSIPLVACVAIAWTLPYVIVAVLSWLFPPMDTVRVPESLRPRFGQIKEMMRVAEERLKSMPPDAIRGPR